MLTIDPFKAQDIFTARMLNDYQHISVLNQIVYQPYFNWKQGKTNTISRQEAYAIQDAVSEDLWNLYQKYPHSQNVVTSFPIWGAYAGYGKDKYLVSYLEHIDGEISNFMV